MKPEHGSVSLSMPAYVSWIAAGPCGATLHVNASSVSDLYRGGRPPLVFDLREESGAR